MTRQLEQGVEDRQIRIDKAVLKAVSFDLENAFRQEGSPLEGFSIKIGQFDYLMTLRAIIGGERSVCFVGADTIGGCLTKAVREARGGKLKWRENKF